MMNEELPNDQEVEMSECCFKGTVLNFFSLSLIFFCSESYLLFLERLHEDDEDDEAFILV